MAQNTERQEYTMPDGIEKYFIDKASGKNTDRPQLKAMMDFIREGDIVYFESFSRISRSLHDLLSILDTFNQKGVSFVSLKEQIDTSGATSATSKLIIAMIGAISEYEREINAERREYGYIKACKDGRVGRPAAKPTEKFINAVKEWRAGTITATEAIKRSGLTRTTFYKLVKENQNK